MYVKYIYCAFLIYSFYLNFYLYTMKYFKLGVSMQFAVSHLGPATNERIRPCERYPEEEHFRIFIDLLGEG